MTVGAAGYRSVNAALAAAHAILVTLGPAAATTPDRPAERAAEYDRCMNLTRGDPQSALDQATGWQARGGGAPARHCAAVALGGLRRYAEAQGITGDWDSTQTTPDERLVSTLAMICPFKANEKQALLEASSLAACADLLLALLDMAAAGGDRGDGDVRH